MDATKKPLTIPPDFSNYAENQGIFQLLQFMLEELLLIKPDDPIEFLIKLLDNSGCDNVPRAVIYGPPASGQFTISKALARKLRTVHIRPIELLYPDQTYSDTPIPLLELEDGEKIANLLFERIQQNDCKTKGFIIDGYPRTREQVLHLQAKGVMVSHCVLLKAQNSVLLERYNGKRIDPITGDIYHLVFKPPTDKFVATRLIEEPGGVSHNMDKRLKYYSSNINGIQDCYKNISKIFDADQPECDLTTQVHSFLQKRSKSLAPHTPRVVFLGPTGVGKSFQATQLSSKYHLIQVDVTVLVKQELTCGSQLGHQMKPFVERNLAIPDEMLMKILINKLTQLECTTRGWVLHGFPLTREHAEQLHKHGLSPNRVFIITAPVDVIKERVCWRRIDPITGERYHLLYNPPLSQEVKQRLITHPDDDDDIIDNNIADYNATITDIEDYYNNISITINGDCDPYIITESLESYIINPLPKKTQN